MASMLGVFDDRGDSHTGESDAREAERRTSEQKDGSMTRLRKESGRVARAGR